MGSVPEPAPTNERRVALQASLRRYVPIVRWLPRYERSDLGPDLVAGLTTWGVMVPVALAYATLAGLPPEYGLITAFAALAAYAIFGTSRHLRVTTSSTMAIMSFSLVTPLAGGDAMRFLALSAALALIVGALLVIAGVARLGFISEFLAKPVVTGFIIGVAVTVIVRQLPKLLGIPGSSGSVFDQLRSIIVHLPETDTLTLAVGLGALLLIFGLRALDRRIPGPLVAMILGIGAVVVFGLAEQGVAVVGEVATLMPTVGLPERGPGRPDLPDHGSGGHRLPGRGRVAGCGTLLRGPAPLRDRRRPGADRARRREYRVRPVRWLPRGCQSLAVGHRRGLRRADAALRTRDLRAGAGDRAPAGTLLREPGLGGAGGDHHRLGARPHRRRGVASLLGLAPHRCAAGDRGTHRRGHHRCAGRPRHRRAALAADAAAARQPSLRGSAGTAARRPRRVRRPEPPPRRRGHPRAAHRPTGYALSTSSTAA